MERSEQIADFAAAMAKAQGLIEGAIKGKVNPAFRSSYADLGAVWDAIREPLTANGLSVLQELTSFDGKVSCATEIVHSSGQWVLFAPLTLPVGKQDAQGYGAAATYARRYSLMAAVGISPVDDDGNAAVGRPDRPAERHNEPEMPAGLLEAAQEAALGGRATFAAFWKSASPGARSALAQHMDSLKAAVQAAEAGSQE